MSDCIKFSSCLNNDKCWKCYDKSLLKEPKKKTTMKTMQPKKGAVRITADAPDSWKTLEQDVADALNQVPDIAIAHRSLASGALWFQKGDVVDDLLHPECKERIGSESANGAEKTFSMKRSWLEKAKEEALQFGKAMCLPFRFKEDSNIYIVFTIEDIAELIVNMKALIHENAKLKAELKVLRNHVKEEEK